MAKEDLTTLSLNEKLSKIQVEFKANKSKWNSFGKYNFRSAEDILEALKPFNEKYGVYFIVNEDLVSNATIPMLKSTATIFDTKVNEALSATSIVGVDLAQKGMQTPQAFGSASSYGKKYALGNLLLIDDTQDADATNTYSKDDTKVKTATETTKTELVEGSEAYAKALEYVAGGGLVSNIEKKYIISEPLKQKLLAINKLQTALNEDSND